MARTGSIGLTKTRAAAGLVSLRAGQRHAPPLSQKEGSTHTALVPPVCWTNSIVQGYGPFYQWEVVFNCWRMDGRPTFLPEWLGKSSVIRIYTSVCSSDIVTSSSYCTFMNAYLSYDKSIDVSRTI